MPLKHQGTKDYKRKTINKITFVDLRAFVSLWQINRKRIIALFLILYALFQIYSPSFAQEENIKAEILEEVNRVRQAGCKCGEKEMPPVGELSWSDKLEKAAIRHAADIAEHEHFDHTGTDGSSLSDRVNAVGYKWSLIGENISWGYSSAEDVVEGWISSEGHCHNMMNPAFKEMGTARKGTYWVLDLGAGN
jgi:uncharacterized protein YkwD